MKNFENACNHENDGTGALTGPRRQLRMIAHESLHRLDFAVEHLAGAWSLRNACVVYQAHGRQLSAQFVSFEGRTAHILAFSEYRFSFVRVSNVRAARSSERERYRRRCAARSLGIAAPLLQNNLFHALSMQCLFIQTQSVARRL